MRVANVRASSAILRHRTVRIFNDIPRPIWLFTAIWFVMGCIQAAMMELHPDEAYQWQVSRLLDWGYFHHPPMIALFIKVGYALFENELGVRLTSVLASTIGIPLLFKLSETVNVRIFILVYLSFILTQAGSFFAAPDAPLILFSLLFLVTLKHYLKNDSYLIALVLAFIVAALMYSKYHAIVLFGSCLVAVPRLLLRKSFWLTLVVSVMLFLPHVLWQFDHDLISYKFNWVIRDKAEWDFGLVINYLAGQLILLGPVGILLLIAIAKLKDRVVFDRVLVSIILGFFGFFLFLSFRGRIEANWTATAFLPLIILGTRSIAHQTRLLNVFRPAAILCAAILMIGRIYLTTPWAGVGIPTSFPLRGWNAWAQAIKEKADGKPVFFANSYQYVSQYSFYSGEQGYHWSMLNYNGNQFDLWNMDSVITGGPFVTVFPFGHDSTLAVAQSEFPTFYVCPVPSYHSYRNLRFSFEQKRYVVPTDSEFVLTGVIFNGTGSAIDLDQLLTDHPVYVFYYVNSKNEFLQEADCNGCTGILPHGESRPVSFRLRIPEGSDTCFVRFGLEFAFEIPEQNSDFVQLKVNRD